MGDFVNNEIPLLLLFLYLLNEINMVISYFRKSIVICVIYIEDIVRWEFDWGGTSVKK